VYDPRVFTRPDGSQILVSIYTRDTYGSPAVTVAERPSASMSWGPPIKEDAK